MLESVYEFVQSAGRETCIFHIINIHLDEYLLGKNKTEERVSYSSNCLIIYNRILNLVRIMDVSGFNFWNFSTVHSNTILKM
jgi:hypothetical protein